MDKPVLVVMVPYSKTLAAYLGTDALGPKSI